MKSIVLAGGCFWGIEAYFKRINGVLATRVGYAQGNEQNPNYEKVCTGETGHAEVCDIIFDDDVITLEKILEHFFKIINPTLINQQGEDIGTQYRTGIYYNNDNDLDIINKVIEIQQTKYKEKIVTEVEVLDMFYDAEEYHQEYFEKNENAYCHINLSLIKAEEKQDPIRN